MSRQSRSVFLTAVLTASAVVVATLPAGAQTREGLLLTGKASVSRYGQHRVPDGGDGRTGDRHLREAAGPRAEGFGIGAKIGPLFTSYSAASCDDCFNTNTGWEGGIWFGGNRGGRVGVMGEILYAKKKQEARQRPDGQHDRFSTSRFRSCCASTSGRAAATASASTDSSDRCSTST